jgi:arylsulfatase A
MSAQRFIHAVLLPLAATVTAWANLPPQPPNIVLIIADDQAWRDFGFMGNADVYTPNLDKLARQSARFVNGYVPTSVCRPSLATLLTGLYPRQHGIYFNHPPPGYPRLLHLSAAEWRVRRAAAERIVRGLPTLPRVLAANGFACLQTGKHWEGDFRNAGFTHGMTLNKPSPPPAYGNRTLKDGIVAHGNGDAGLLIGRDTMQPIYDFLDQHHDQPFFIWYAPLLPHVPFDAPPRFRHRYENRPEIPQHLVAYYAEITRFDETVGQLLQALDERGLTKRTLIIFIIDNGFRPAVQQGGTKPDLRSKRSPYEDGVRTPILIFWPGRARPGTHEPLVQSIDTVPTILAAAGIQTLIPDLPGIDLLPAAIGESPLPERPAFGEIYPNDAATLGDPAGNMLARWMRQGDYKLIVLADNDINSTALYNLRYDPEERHNLANSPEHAERLEQMRRLLDDWWKPQACSR